MVSPTSAALRKHLSAIAPGTVLRDGLDRIVHGRTGALVVLGENEILGALCTGGFTIDAPLSATSLRELAKMDGAIVLSADLKRIRSASTHLMPDAAVHTIETGTRHRTAERVARQTGLPVVTVSAAMGTITLFVDHERYTVQQPEPLLARANQAISALMGYRERLFESLDHLTDLEVQNHVTLRDVAQVVQRFEMTNRLADEVAFYVAEMGVDGRLVSLQLHDLTSDLTSLASLLQRDYGSGDSSLQVFGALRGLDDTELFDVVVVAKRLGLGQGLHLDSVLRPRGFRAIASIPRIPSHTGSKLVENFSGLDELFAASINDLTSIDGVTSQVARTVREGLTRIAESVLTR